MDFCLQYTQGQINLRVERFIPFPRYTMSALPQSSHSSEQALDLHRRLLEDDPVAPTELAHRYLQKLIDFLRWSNPGISEDLCIQAAGDAILALIRNPRSYQPARGSLEDYLRMSARGDLLNAHQKERRYRSRHQSWSVVELSDDAGKYIGSEEDPSLWLCIAEEQAQHAVPPEWFAQLDEQDQQAMDLWLTGESRTAVFAEVYNLTHLPFAEQRREVKRNKDRLTKSRQRWEKNDDEPR